MRHSFELGCGRLGFGVLALVCMASAAQAQTVNPPTVPLEFVQMFSTITPFPTMGTPEIVVEGLPEVITRDLQLPADARIVGSVVYTGMTSSIVAIPGQVEAAIEDWSARIVAAGWRRYEQPTNRGFQSAVGGGASFCAPDSTTTLNIGGLENVQGRDYLFLITVTNPDFSVCHGKPHPRRMEETPPVPELAAPEGAMIIGGGYRSGSDAWNFSTHLRTELSLAHLIVHYGGQLQSSGWVPTSRTEGNDVVVETLRFTGADGVVWSGVLTSTALPGDSDRFISFNITRLSGGL